MESNFFQFSGPIIIDWLYIVTVVLGSDVLMRITLATKLKRYAVYTVLVFAFIVGLVFWVLNSTEQDTELKIKSLLQNDNSKQQRIESDTV